MFPSFFYQYNSSMLHDDADNTSNVTFINEIWGLLPLSEIIIKVTILLPVVLLALVGNLMLIYILLTNRQIQTPTNMLIGNMAIADFFSVLVHPWIMLAYDIFQNYELGRFICITEAGIECSLLIASVISLSVISYDRLTAIVLPKENRLNRRGTKIVIAITWVVSMLSTIPLYIQRNYKQRQWRNFLEKYCTENTIIANVYWFVVITVIVWLPLTIQLICYAGIFIELTKYEKVILRKLNPHQVNYKKKAVRMMFLVISTFMVCRLPFTSLIIYRHQLIESNGISKNHPVQSQVNSFYYTLWYVSKYLIFLNSALNPIIYGVTNEKFRRAFKGTKFSVWFFAPRSVSVITTRTRTKSGKAAPESERESDKGNLMFLFRRNKKKCPGLGDGLKARRTFFCIFSKTQEHLKNESSTGSGTGISTSTSAGAGAGAGAGTDTGTSSFKQNDLI